MSNRIDWIFHRRKSEVKIFHIEPFDVYQLFEPHPKFVMEFFKMFISFADQRIFRPILDYSPCFWRILINFSALVFQKIKQLFHYIGNHSFFVIFCEGTNIHGFNHVINRNYYPFER